MSAQLMTDSSTSDSQNSAPNLQNIEPTLDNPESTVAASEPVLANSEPTLDMGDIMQDDILKQAMALSMTLVQEQEKEQEQAKQQAAQSEQPAQNPQVKLEENKKNSEDELMLDPELLQAIEFSKGNHERRKILKDYEMDIRQSKCFHNKISIDEIYEHIENVNKNKIGLFSQRYQKFPSQWQNEPYLLIESNEDQIAGLFKLIIFYYEFSKLSAIQNKNNTETIHYSLEVTETIFCPDDMGYTEVELQENAFTTNVKPVLHHSDLKKFIENEYSNEKIQQQASWQKNENPKNPRNIAIPLEYLRQKGITIEQYIKDYFEQQKKSSVALPKSPEKPQIKPIDLKADLPQKPNLPQTFQFTRLSLENPPQKPIINISIDTAKKTQSTGALSETSKMEQSATSMQIDTAKTDSARTDSAKNTDAALQMKKKEIVDHPHYIDINLDTLNNYLTQQVDNGSPYVSELNCQLDKSSEWQAKPYIIRPVKKSPGVYCLTIFYYLYQLKISDKVVDEQGKGMFECSDLKLCCHEVLFNITNDGYQICKIKKNKTEPNAPWKAQSLLEFINRLKDENFHAIIKQSLNSKLYENEHIVSFDKLIEKKHTFIRHVHKVIRAQEKEKVKAAQNLAKPQSFAKQSDQSSLGLNSAQNQSSQTRMALNANSMDFEQSPILQFSQEWRPWDEESQIQEAIRLSQKEILNSEKAAQPKQEKKK